MFQIEIFMFPADSPIKGRMDIVIKQQDCPAEHISVRAYKGTSGKIMKKLGFAILSGVNKKGEEVFVSKRSLGKRILIAQGMEQKKITNSAKDKAIKILLEQSPFSEKNKESPLHVREMMKAIAELEICKDQEKPLFQKKLQEAQLSEIMSEAELDLVWNNKQRFPSSNSREASLSKDILYDYINGVTDGEGNIQELAASKDPLEYVGGLRGLIDENSTVTVGLQTTGGLEPVVSPEAEERSKMITPLDQYFKDPEALSRFQNLPAEHKEYILESAQANYLGLSPEKKEELMRKEYDLKQAVVGEQRSEFTRCMDYANRQNAARSGFIHFRSQGEGKRTPYERIYIQMNKERAEDLTRLLISELYDKGEHPGILDIKVAGPQVAGRTDGIVIYIGGVPKSPTDDKSARKKAIKERDKVLKKLTDIQQQQPELFSTSAMPFKQVHAPGVAIIPGLSSSESFTKQLSKAIVAALAISEDRKDFRNKIIETFFAAE